MDEGMVLPIRAQSTPKAISTRKAPSSLPAPCRPGAMLECAGMYSLYLHIPFCQVRCAYCDFNTYAGLQDLIPRYIGALAEEVRQVSASLRSTPGTRATHLRRTPSSLAAEHLPHSTLAATGSSGDDPCGIRGELGL